MITVTISVNGMPIYTRSAIRVRTGKPNVYRVDDGSSVTHDYDDGAIVLAHKLLDTIKEPKHVQHQSDAR